MGAGDKDTFWLGSAAYHRDFHVVERGIELITAKRTDGSLWNPKTGIFNGAMGQFNPADNGEVFFMHVCALLPFYFPLFYTISNIGIDIVFT